MRRILPIFFLLSHLIAVGQQTYEITFTDQRADIAVKALAEEFNLKISFDPSLLEEHRVTAQISAKTEDELLKIFTSYLPLRHKRAGDVIMLIPARKQSSRKNSGNIRGRIYDRKTGQPLALANVSSQQLRTKTDPSGGFSVLRQRDSIQITVSYLGYEPNSMWVPTDLEEVSIHLTPSIDELRPFILDPASRDNSQKNLVSHFSINPNQISSLPALGQPDVLKSLQLLPGIMATDESTTGLVVRGSAPEQNLVLLDGYTIYHMDHFFGLFSTFNPNIINHVDIYKGAFSAEYGRRTSSVVEATTRGSNLENASGGVGVNSTSIDGFVEVPIGKKLGIVLGARAAHDGLVSNRIYQQFLEEHRRDIVNAQEPDPITEFDIDSDFSFFDTNAKISYKPNPKTQLDLSLFISEDNYQGAFEEEDEDVGAAISYGDEAFWANSGASLRWQSHWNDKHTSVFTLSGSGYESRSELLWQTAALRDVIAGAPNDFDTLFEEGEVLESFGVTKQNTIEDVTLAFKSNVQLNASSRLTVGTEISSYKTNLEIEVDQSEELLLDTAREESSLITMFGNYQYAKDKWQFNIGLRVNNYDLLSRSDLEPRLGLRYYITDELSAAGSWSRHTQFLNRITLSPFGNSDQYYWVLANGDEFPVLESSHFIAGFKWQKGPLTFDVEGYLKKTDGITESEFTLFSEFNGIDPEEIEDFQPDGDNIARGIDFFARYKGPRFSTWLGYTLASSVNKFDSAPLPDSYYSVYDQRHEINQVNLYKLGKWEFGSTFIFGSGRPYTPPGDLEEDDPVFYDLTQLNSQRLPTYHRLDLSVKYQYDLKWMKIEAGLTLFNVYDRRNIKSRRFSAVFEPTGAPGEEELTLVGTPVDIELLGRTPNFFVNLLF